MASTLLEKVLESQERNQMHSFNPVDVVTQLLKVVTKREQEILQRRYGLGKTKEETLEEIGTSYDLTRERIRQLERAALVKIKSDPSFKEHTSTIEGLALSVLEKYGGLMEHSHLVVAIYPHAEHSDEHLQHITFLLEGLLDHVITRVIKRGVIHPSWQIANMNADATFSLINKIEDLLTSMGEPVNEQELIREIQKLHPSHHENIIEAAMRISSKIKRNIFGRWGLTHWPHITPRRMADKIYLVLKETAKPLHFEDITRSINDYKFDHKKAHTPTVHNELILDPRFVLIGRGIYALREWGYKEGVVKDLITRILQEKGPLAKEQILEIIKPQRIIKDTTIYLALSDKSRFKRTEDGTYVVA